MRNLIHVEYGSIKTDRCPEQDAIEYQIKVEWSAALISIEDILLCERCSHGEQGGH